MDATADELAGVVDLFGGLTRTELERALSEAAFRDGGQSVLEEVLEEEIEAALEAFALVQYDPDGNDDLGEDAPTESLLVAGPTAFPSVPDAAEDVPHILSIPPRSLDREALGAQVHQRFQEETAAALEEGDEDRIRALVDVSYDLEAWAPIDLAAERERLDGALE